MLDLITSSQFKRDRRLCKKRGCDMALLNSVVDILRIPQKLPQANKDHNLVGRHVGFRECHIQPDWLLIYRIDGNALYLDRTGTHSDLFGS